MKTKIQRLSWVGWVPLALATLGAQAAVIVGNKEWQQPAQFTNLTWNGISAQCNEATGECSGSLKGIGLTGWTWASIDDVGALFVTSGITWFASHAPPSDYAEINSAWAPAFLAIFDPTGDETNMRYVGGWTRSRFDLYSPAIGGINDYKEPSAPDYAATNSSADPTQASSIRGAWFFRSAQVPEPATLILLGMGLAGLRMNRCSALWKRGQG